MLGTTLLNRYRIDTELGQGGMGVVYRAHDTLLNRAVAVKVLNTAGLGTAGRARLLAEARAAAKLNHPNIVTVHDAGEADGSPFIVMELVEGSSLRSQMPKMLAESLTIARQVCAALEHAHSNGIIHRDLKPENIVLTQRQTAKLMDFGLARLAEADGPQLTEEGAVVGTFAYIAPELLMGQSASLQSDLYALGVMLYELTTGHPPFTGDNLAALVAQHLQAEPVSPRKHNPEISSDLNALILKLLSKAPADRPASAGEVLQKLIPGETASTETLRRSGSTLLPNNLPTKLSTFIGREKELARLKRLLSPLSRDEGAGVGSRLVTLTGSGGIGKTRLSIQAAHELLPQFTGGAWLVELAPLADPALVPQTVCTVLEVQPQGNIPPLTALTDYLHEKTLLLVLDNCEHLIDACAQLAEHLLTQCPEVRLLASSREALGIEGETAVRVPSLSLPAVEQATPEALADSEAVQLFVERATAALPGFALTDANAPAIAQVCRRLDGIALAIELAAARVKMLKVEQIATRLDDAFRLLTGGSRTALPRQQTLRATIDWSYNLLSDSERVLLRRLAVFAGGWTLEAAESVCAGEGVDDYGVLDLLIQLANKSLVVVEREQGEEARYSLLETTRQYSREKLLDSGKGDEVRHRHLEYFLKLAQEGEPKLVGAEQIEWLDRFDQEHSNLRAALEWSLESRSEAGLQLVGALWWFWSTRGHLGEGYEQLQKALAVSAGASAPIRAKLLSGAGWLASMLSYHERSVAYSEESAALFRELGDRGGMAFPLATLGTIAHHHSDYEQAKALTEESLALCKEAGNKGGIRHALGILGYTVEAQGNLEHAATLYQESLTLSRESGDKDGVAWSLYLLGNLAMRRGEFDQAMIFYEEGLPISKEVGSKPVITWIVGAMGLVALQRGHYEQARTLSEESLELSRAMGDRAGRAFSLRRLGLVAHLQGDYAQAATRYAESLKLAQETGAKKLIAWNLAGIASLARAQQPERAVRLFGAAEAMVSNFLVGLLPGTRADYEQSLAAIRAQLDEAVFNAALAEGQTMTLEQAIAYALEMQSE